MDAKFWLDAGQWVMAVLASGILGLIGWLARRQTITANQLTKTREDFNKRLDAVKSEQVEEMNRLSRIVAKLEAEVKHLPDTRDFQKLLQEVNSTSGAVKGMQQTLHTLSGSIQLLVDNEIRGGK